MLTRSEFIRVAMGSVAATLVGCGDSTTGTGGAGGTATTGSTSGATSSSSKSSTSGSSGSTTTAGSTTSTTTGTSTSSTGTGQPLTCAAPAVSIGTNHPVGSEHKMTVSMADVNGGVDKIYDIMGNSLHTHSVTLTVADFATLKSTGTVMVTSTTGSLHTHAVTVTCAS